MKKSLAAIVLVVSVTASAWVFAQEAEQVKDVDATAISNEETIEPIMNDEGYGNDEEYYGAEVTDQDTGAMPDNEMPQINADANPEPAPATP